MKSPAPLQRPLALMISLALLSPLPAAAAGAPSTECDATTEQCSESPRKSRAWLWGGLAALGLGAAAGGGGGGGGSSVGGGSGSGGGGGGGPTPGAEGGSFGAGGILASAGARTEWNQPVVTRVTGDARNEGELRLVNGSLHVTRDGELRNNGSLNIGQAATLRLDGDGDLENFGALHVQGALSLEGEGSLENHSNASFTAASVSLGHEAEVDNHARMTLEGGQWALNGDSNFDNNRGGTLATTGTAFQLRGRAQIENSGTLTAAGSFAQGVLFDAVTSQYGNDRDAITVLDNRGHINMQGDAGVLRMVADTFASNAINRSGATVQSSAVRSNLLHAEGGQATLLNQGTLTVTGDGAVAMSGARGATLINDGIINLGTATDAAGRGLVAMKSDGSATLNNRRNGTINIHAADSYAFQAGTGSGRLVNNGKVNVYGAGSGMYADATTAAAGAMGGADLGWQAPRSISNYTVGTNEDGSAGQLNLHGGGTLEDVAVDTGFTRGTDASSITLHDVITGAEGGAANVRSATVVWKADARQQADGSIDVTMQRKDYRSLAGQDQAAIAAALEESYRNEALFHSLEVADQATFQNALHQLSGADLAARSMRGASNGDALWAQLAALPAQRSSVVAFGGGTTNAFGIQGTGSAAQVAVALKGSHSLQLISGALKGEPGSGQDRGHSRFAGVGLASHWGSVHLRHQFGFERHDLQGQRSLAWGQTREVAGSQRRMQRMLLASTISHDARVGNLHWQPRLKASAFQLREAAFSENGAGGFGLQVAAGQTRGLRMEVGSQFHYALASNLSLRADASVTRSIAVRGDAREASLLGASSNAFLLPGVRADGLDHQLALGVDYRRDRLSMGGQVLQQRLWGQNDARAELQVGYRFR